MGTHAHAIGPDDPDALEDEAGFYVPGYRVAPTATGPVSSGRLRVCPEAPLRSWVAGLAQLYRVADGRPEGVAAVLGAPMTGVLVDALDVFDGELATVRTALREREASRRGR